MATYQIYLHDTLLKRKNKIILKQNDSENDSLDSLDSLDVNYLATILRNIESLGYTLSKEVLNVLTSYSLEDLQVFYISLVKKLKKMKGADKKWSPMYSNFPKQVMEMPEAELYLNAFTHYFGKFVLGVTLLPQYDKDERAPLIDFSKLIVINIGTENDIKEIFNNLMTSKTSISEEDRVELTTYLENEYPSQLTIPTITNKEILATVYSILLVNNKVTPKEASQNFKTATDILRLAVSLSEGDVSLAAKTVFRNFKRKERKFLLGLLELCSTDIIEDMLRFKNVWIRLGERLHPFEYKSKLPKCFKAFDIIRNNKKYKTFRSKVEKALLDGEINIATKILKERPGELARRLDHLLRESKRRSTIVNYFKEVVDKISSTVLLQVMTHFTYRKQNKWGIRVFIPKGNMSKIQAIKDNLSVIPDNICKDIANICRGALKKRYKSLSKLGKVYIDPSLKDYTVPFSQRSASKSLRTVSRGSKITIPEGNTLRFFVWWKGNIVDIDLSAIMYDENWKEIEHISYTHLKSSTYKAYHSGDIISAPNGACEFIDLDIPSIIKYGGRYVIMSLFSYSGEPFSEISESMCGWMMRQHPNSGEIFEAKTVQDKLDLDNPSKINVPVIFDLVTRKMIYTDLSLSHNVHCYSNINLESNLSSLALMGQSIESLKKTDLHELFTIHAEARGRLVKSKSKADIVFSVDEGITPFDIDTIVGNYI